MTTKISALEIAERITQAAMAGTLFPNARLGEQKLASLFFCSRTMVREALNRLTARGLVSLSARKGWHVASPNRAQTMEAINAWKIVEIGLFRSASRLGSGAVSTLQEHVELERQAILVGDGAVAAYLLAQFHFCLATALGNTLLAGTLRDLVVKVSLAEQSYGVVLDLPLLHREHLEVLRCIAANEWDAGESLLAALIERRRKAVPAVWADPPSMLRRALTPLPSHASKGVMASAVEWQELNAGPEFF